MYVAYKHDGQVFFDRNRLPKKAHVLSRMGVLPNTFAGGMVSRLYDYYFAHAVDLRTEYRKFYRKEFDSLTDYIEQRYDLGRIEAKRYAEGRFCTKNCSRSSIERNIPDTMNYDEDFVKKFSDAIGGLLDEDPNGFYY